MSSSGPGQRAPPKITRRFVRWVLRDSVPAREIALVLAQGVRAAAGPEVRSATGSQVREHCYQCWNPAVAARSALLLLYDDCDAYKRRQDCSLLLY